MPYSLDPALEEIILKGYNPEIDLLIPFGRYAKERPPKGKQSEAQHIGPHKKARGELKDYLPSVEQIALRDRDVEWRSNEKPSRGLSHLKWLAGLDTINANDAAYIRAVAYLYEKFPVKIACKGTKECGNFSDVLAVPYKVTANIPERINLGGPEEINQTYPEQSRFCCDPCAKKMDEYSGRPEDRKSGIITLDITFRHPIITPAGKWNLARDSIHKIFKRMAFYLTENENDVIDPDKAWNAGAVITIDTAKIITNRLYGIPLKDMPHYETRRIKRKSSMGRMEQASFNFG
jgi:hypothetical protein